MQELKKIIESKQTGSSSTVNSPLKKPSIASTARAVTNATGAFGLRKPSSAIGSGTSKIGKGSAAK